MASCRHPRRRERKRTKQPAVSLRLAFAPQGGTVAPRRGSDLQHIALASDHLVQHGIDEKAEHQAGNQPGDNHDRKRLLGVRSHARGHGRRQQTQTSHERRHHDWPQAQKRSFACRLAGRLALETQLIDIADQNHGGLDRYAEQRQNPRMLETLNGVCVSFSAISAPTGSVITTPSAMLTGNLKLPYSAKRIRKMSRTASGPITKNCAFASSNSLYSPPQSSR